MKASISEYLQSRRFNRKLFERIVEAIEELQFDATAELEMSAKTQSPLVVVRGRECDAAADEIKHLLDQYFRVGGIYPKDDDTIHIYFEDQY